MRRLKDMSNDSNRAEKSGRTSGRSPASNTHLKDQWVRYALKRLSSPLDLRMPTGKLSPSQSAPSAELVEDEITVVYKFAHAPREIGVVFHTNAPIPSRYPKEVLAL